ncbi:MAG TPA: sulfur carrier protein ThiS adenylyltransferase ThiF [Syntrophorhabdales bacterium]|nr:sulfur carrier protein ThiS adenylyltransferase ThiF [Syntrophorhabdales bacterium]
MQIRVNEKVLSFDEGMTLFRLRELCKPGADLVIYNGFPAADLEVKDGDAVQLIRRGELPTPEEMEALIVARHTPGVHGLLKKATVGIAGLGGLGSSCAVALCRMGIGRLVLADFDVVEPSNLNRQQYFVDQIGMYKTEATRQNLERINPYVSLETHCLMLDESNIPLVFSEASVVVEAFDRAEMKAMIVKTVLGAMPGVSVVAASGVAGYGDGNEVRVAELTRRLFIIGDGKSEARPGMGLMASRVGIASHQQANTAVRIILGDLPAGDK